MVKNKLVRNAVAVVVALGVIGTIPVFAESYDMEDGHAYNNATSSGGIKCCDAGTINDRSGGICFFVFAYNISGWTRVRLLVRSGTGVGTRKYWLGLGRRLL